VAAVEMLHGGCLLLKRVAFSSSSRPFRAVRLLFMLAGRADSDHLWDGRGSVWVWLERKCGHGVRVNHRDLSHNRMDGIWRARNGSLIMGLSFVFLCLGDAAGDPVPTKRW